LRLMCSVKLPFRCRVVFQGCMHPKSCEGRFVCTAITGADRGEVEEVRRLITMNDGDE
jgi:hypothetical protein